MTNSRKSELLRLIAGIAPGGGVAEHESNDQKFFRNFLPLPNYKVVLEPDTLLILGGRGSGKTELFRLLARDEGRKILVQHTGARSLPDLKSTIWIPAFGRAQQQGKDFPPPEVVEQVMTSLGALQWRSFWTGLLLGVILAKAKINLNVSWASSLSNETEAALANLSRPSVWFPLVAKDYELASFSLDQLDEQLKKENKWLFVTYDELDRLMPAYADLAVPIRELLAFWLDRWRRWERIRPKVFLRTDLFQQEFLGFPDASKLQGHQVRLEWQAIQLYQLLAKRLANSDSSMAQYVAQTKGLLPKVEDPLVGFVPATDDTLLKSLIERMIGKYMGSTVRKGYTYSWIPNHLQDAGGRIAPRSFLKLFALAAEQQLQQPSAIPTTDDLLLQPSALQAALMQTSEDRIKELAQEEYPWLEALATTLKGLEMPMDKGGFIKLLKQTKWSEDNAKRPPSDDPNAIMNKMLLLGVVELRSDNRINMPEIYLYGFKLKRRGGIMRPK